MKQKTVVGKVFALAVICLAALFVINTQMGRASKTLVVPDNYPTISAAVGNASQGDTVQVRSGVYYENVIINKAVSVVGEDSENTIIMGTGGVERGARAVFTLGADGVKLSGFTIESRNYSSSTYYATGIIVEGDNCSIIGNNIRNTYVGIFCSVQSKTIIVQNTITANLKDGIRFFGGSLNKISENNIVGNSQSGIVIEGYSNTISGNNITNNWRGIGLGSSYSVIFGNRLMDNIESGIFLAGSNDIISANDIAENKWG
ncbi:MAG TPA: right-handed parallel beta-helix repeat-containing protein, partial [Candidatus Bathyarchaeia archaeon]|nr:right-handed parallel beta-helix repeat-containing protein [Candidatus Bathyarchaeia archaeon]